MNSTKSLPKPPSLLNSKTWSGLIFLAALLWSLQTAGIFNGNLINQGGWSLVQRFIVASIHPDFSPEILKITLEATFKTLAYAVCGTFFSLIIGLVGGILCSEVWWQAVSPTKANHRFTPWLVVRAVLAIPRAIHELIWGLFFVNILGLDPLVAILAIAIPFGTITAKVFSEIFDETPRQPLNALLNSGVSPLTAFTYTLIPQAFLNLLSYSFYRFECSIRAAAVLGIIGAGGLGYQMLLSLQSLRYEEMWTFLIALVLLSGFTDFWSALLRQRLGAPSRLDLNVLNLKKPQINHTQNDPIIKTSLFALIILLIFSFWYVQADFSKLWAPRTAKLLAGVIKDAFPPDFSQLNQLFSLSTQTLAMSILAIAFAGLGGILLSFPAAHNFLLPGKNQGRLTHWTTFLLILTRFLLLFLRAVPEPIWALIFLFVLFPGILPGAIALCLHNLGILGRLMAEVMENLDSRPDSSLKALGATNPQIFLYSVIPRTLPRNLAYILYRWEVCIRASVIVGLVGAGGLGRLMTEQLSSFDYKGLLTTLLVFIALTFFVDLISAKLRQTLR
ncbi:MAG: ABC transporter permease subunit [Coleofasciculaceae cyanobacterium]